MHLKTIALAALLLLAAATHAAGDSEREVTFHNGDLALAGTLYLPEGTGPFPAVVFVHGSGPEERGNSDYSARWLASIGYAALAYDKRGTGNSGGTKQSWSRFSFDDLAGDVLAAVEFLARQDEIDSARIGLHASSQGGWVAPLAASRTPLISFMVMRSASVTSVGDDRVFERARRLQQEGFSAADIAEAQEMQAVEAKTTAGREAPDAFTRLFAEYQSRPWFPRVYPVTDPFDAALVDYREWYATIVGFDPLPCLQQSDIPVFWIFGDAELDDSGPVAQSLRNLATLQQAGKRYEIVQLAGEGHNIDEHRYEEALYRWLNEVTGQTGYGFKPHQN